MWEIPDRRRDVLSVGPKPRTHRHSSSPVRGKTRDGRERSLLWLTSSYVFEFQRVETGVKHKVFICLFGVDSSLVSGTFRSGPGTPDTFRVYSRPLYSRFGLPELPFLRGSYELTTPVSRGFEKNRLAVLHRVGRLRPKPRCPISSREVRTKVYRSPEVSSENRSRTSRFWTI